jgi:hypothetical protein
MAAGLLSSHGAYHQPRPFLPDQFARIPDAVPTGQVATLAFDVRVALALKLADGLFGHGAIIECHFYGSFQFPSDRSSI